MSTMWFETRPILLWPGQLRQSHQRKPSPFGAGYEATLDLLAREVLRVGGTSVIIELALSSADIRVDGTPKARASPAHPGVIVSFGSKHGPLRYHTDVFDHWVANLRAVALGLESLRRIDRYGIAERGEQYTGWSALPPGDGASPAPPVQMTVEAAQRFLLEHSEDTYQGSWRALYRVAAKRLHPDAGGDAALFRQLEDARGLLENGGHW